MSALLAGLGALFAMRHVMFGAFVPAGLADICAECANCLDMGATSGHGSSSKRTNLGAVHIQRYALNHHLDVGLVQTGSCAMVTGHGAGVASVNAGTVLLMRHGDFPKTGFDTAK